MVLLLFLFFLNNGIGYGEASVSTGETIGGGYNPELGIHKPAQLGIPKFSREECESSSGLDGNLISKLDEEFRRLRLEKQIVPTEIPPGWDSALKFKSESEFRSFFLRSLFKAYFQSAQAPTATSNNFCNHLLGEQAQESKFAKVFQGIKRPMNYSEWAFLQKGLLPSEVTMIRMFTNRYSWNLDGYLLDKADQGKKSELTLAMDTLDSALGKLPRQSGKVRTFLEAGATPFVLASLAKNNSSQRVNSEKLKVGMLLRTPSFLSTSVWAEWSRARYRISVDEMFRGMMGLKTFIGGELKPLDEYIILPRSDGETKARRSGDFSTVSEEREVTFERSACFLVTKKNKNWVNETVGKGLREKETFRYRADKFTLQEIRCL